MTIRIELARSNHTWSIRLNLSQAPDTARDYSPQVIHPDQLEVIYQASGDGPTKISSVRLSGPATGHPVDSYGRAAQVWFTYDQLPEWIRPIVDRYAPTRAAPVDTVAPIR